MNKRSNSYHLKNNIGHSGLIAFHDGMRDNILPLSLLCKKVSCKYKQYIELDFLSLLLPISQSIIDNDCPSQEVKRQYLDS